MLYIVKENTIEPGPCVNCGQPKKPSFREFYCDCVLVTKWDRRKWEDNLKRFQGAWEHMCDAPFYIECMLCKSPALFLRGKPVNGTRIDFNDLQEVLNKLHPSKCPDCESCGESLQGQPITTNIVYPNPYHIPF